MTAESIRAWADLTRKAIPSLRATLGYLRAPIARLRLNGRCNLTSIGNLDTFDTLIFWRLGTP